MIPVMDRYKMECDDKDQETHLRQQQRRDRCCREIQSQEEKRERKDTERTMNDRRVKKLAHLEQFLTRSSRVELKFGFTILENTPTRAEGE